MRNPAWPKCSVLLMLALPILTACVAEQTPPPVATVGDLTRQKQVEPLACSEFQPLRFQPGMDGVTPKDVEQTMTAHPSDPIAWARGTVGDTVSTRNAIANYQARRIALGCKTY